MQLVNVSSWSVRMDAFVQGFQASSLMIHSEPGESSLAAKQLLFTVSSKGKSITGGVGKQSGKQRRKSKDN